MLGLNIGEVTAETIPYDSMLRMGFNMLAESEDDNVWPTIRYSIDYYDIEKDGVVQLRRSNLHYDYAAHEYWKSEVNRR